MRQSCSEARPDPGPETFALAPLPPSPHEPLEVAVRCRAGGRGRSVTHAVTLAPDWSVTTPHDLDLERVAVAMGGDRISCLDLVERELPALRELVQLRARRVPPGLVRTDNGRWAVRDPVPGCACGTLRTDSATTVAEHARDVEHAAARARCAPRRLAALLAAVERAHDQRWRALPRDEWCAGDAVREHDGLARLWQVGLHPELVARIHAAIWPGGPPMPSWFYVGAATRRSDLQWLSRTLAVAPDPAIAVWLAWTANENDAVAPTTRGDWLRAGIPRPAILALTDAGYTAADIARLSANSERSIPRAGLVLAAWYQAGCRPAVADLLGLDRMDVDPWYEPSRKALDWVWARLHPSLALTRTQVGLILAACGTRTGALYAIGHGARDPESAVRTLGEPT